MAKARSVNLVRDENHSIACCEEPRSESGMKTYSLCSALAVSRQRIQALSNDDLVSEFKQKLIEFVDRTVELACFVAELNRRGMDLSVLDKSRLDRYLAIAHGKLLPELYEKFSHTPWLAVFEGYGEKLQEQVLIGKFEVATAGAACKTLTFDEMNASQRQQVFAPEGPRNIESQNAAHTKEPELISRDSTGTLNRVLRAIAAAEQACHAMGDRDKIRLLEAAINLARTLGFEGNVGASVAEQSENQKEIRDYLELHGAARGRVIAADLDMNPKRVTQILEGGPFVHKGDGGFAQIMPTAHLIAGLHI